MTARYPLLGGSVLALALLAVTPALAGWGPDGATIRATTNNIPKVAAANDGGYGAIVAWQEDTPTGKFLRAQHVLATGDVDPSWPADGVLLSNFDVNRTALGAVSDELGGAYVWWKENAAIYVSRVAPEGALATGWPARGRGLGPTWMPEARPSVIPDGAHGIYLAWNSTSLATDPVSVMLIHLGPGNTGAGGWPNSVRAAAGGDPVPTIDYWPQIALAPDGGVFVAWASYSYDTEVVPSAYRLRRLTSAGLNAAGWPVEGMDLGLFHGEWLDFNDETSVLALADDDRGGVFASVGFLTSFDGYQAYLETRVFRFQGDGQSAADWPVAGVVASGPWVYSDQGPDPSYRMLPDGLDGAQVGIPAYYDHGTGYGFSALLPSGSPKPSSGTGGNPFGAEVASGLGGDIYFASFHPNGPLGPYQPYAHLLLSRSQAPPQWSDFFEIHFETGAVWYGDIGLAESGDGGAYFFWSQVRDRYGLFARRFNGQGQVTGIPTAPEITTVSLERLRFVPGEGVRASFALPPGRAGNLDLFDVAGRRLASAPIDASRIGVGELTLPGTRALGSGMYFAMLSSGAERRGGKVIVAR